MTTIEWKAVRDADAVRTLLPPGYELVLDDAGPEIHGPQNVSKFETLGECRAWCLGWRQRDVTT